MRPSHLSLWLAGFTCGVLGAYTIHEYLHGAAPAPRVVYVPPPARPLPTPRSENSARPAPVARPAPAVSDPVDAPLPAWSEQGPIAQQCAADHPRPRRPPASPDTGDPLPARPVHNAACASGPSVTSFLGRDPHTPFAVFDGEEIESAEQACCAVWARRGARWRAIDAWGQLVGRVEVSGGAGYDASRCFELCMHVTEGTAGIGVYVSEQGPWRPPPSARWVPSAEERAAFEQFAQTVDGLFVEVDRFSSDDPPLPPRASRTLFFQAAADADHPGLPTRFAVWGGAGLVIAYRAADGRWLAGHIDPPEMYRPRLAHQPIGVFDIDGDGFPEVVLHFNDGDGWGDVILRSSTHGQRWEQVAESVGGSTA